MGMVELFLPLAVVLSFTVIIGLITNLIATGMLNRTIREAMRSDPGSVPVLIQKLDSRQPWADGLLGWIFLAFALALLVLGLMESDPEQRTEMLKASVIPAIVGAVVLLYLRFARPDPARQA